jgi:hypothetical protein
LLAVGTLCWWQRTAGPLNAPRPQDEAELMTACLERHYAMGRTTTNFTITRAENVSTVADSNAPGGFRYVTNAAAFTLTNTIGFFPNATFQYPQSIRDALADGVGAYGTANARKWLLPSNTYWQAGTRDWTWTGGMLSSLLTTETNWWTNLVTLSTKTELSTIYSNIVDSNVVTGVSTGYVVTSTLEDSDHYYVKDRYDAIDVMWPKGTVFPPAGGGGTLRFIIPAHDSYDSMTVSELSVPTHRWAGSSADGWFGRSATVPIGTMPVTLTPVTGYGSGNITLLYGVFTNYATTRQSILVTTQTAFNAWPTKSFAFERDAKPYTWSTNAYNDMARALSMMQWQGNEAQYTATRRQATISIFSAYEVDVNNTDVESQPPGCTFPSGWVLAYSTETNYCNAYKARIMSISTNTTSLAPRMVVSIGELTPDSMVQYTLNPGSEWDDSLISYSGQTNWLCFSQTITLDFVSGNVSTTNATAFVWTNGAFFLDGYVITNASAVNRAMGVFNGWTNGPAALLPNPWRAEPGSGVASGQLCEYPLTGSGGDEAEWQAMLAAALTMSSNIWDNCGGVIPYSGYSITNHSYSHTLPYYELSAAPSNRCAYRVQFTALTNYLDHAPAR